MTVATATLLALQQLIAKELGYASGTMTGSPTNTQVIDTSADSPFDPDDDAQLYANSWVMIEQDDTTNSAAGTDVGEIRRISSYSPSSQLLTIRGVFTAAPMATNHTHQYGVYMGLPPARLGSVKGALEYINEVLRESYYKTYDLLSEAVDPNMESTAVTDWSATNATLTKATTAATGVFLGAQALKVVATAANGAAAQTFQVRPSETWDISADLYGTSGDSAALYVTDDASTPVTGIVTSVVSQIRNQRLYLRLTTGSDAKTMTVSLRSVANTDISYWDNLSVRRAQQTWIALPSWVTRQDQIEEVEFWVPGSSPATGVGNLDDMRRDRVQWWKVAEDYAGVTPFRLEFWPTPRQDALIVVRAIRPFATLTASTTSTGTTEVTMKANQSTTTANQDMLKALVLARFWAEKGDKDKAARWAAEGQQLAQRYSAQVAKRMQLAEPV